MYFNQYTLQRDSIRLCFFSWPSSESDEGKMWRVDCGTTELERHCLGNVPVMMVKMKATRIAISRIEIDNENETAADYQKLR